MKLSVWSSYHYRLSPEEALRDFKAHGYDYCEFSDEHSTVLLERGDPYEIGREFGKFAKELGMELSQGHLFLEAKICREKDRELIKKQLTLFKEIGVKNAVLHLDSLDWKNKELSIDEIREENVKALADLLDYIKDTDMVICLENLVRNKFDNCIDGLMYFIEKFNSKNLGICLDTGHLNLVDKDQVAFIRKGGKHIKALHLADNDATGKDQHLMPYERGTVDFVSVISEMKKLNYEGLYNLEIPGEHRAPREVLGLKLDYIKKMFEYLDSVTEN